MNNLKFLLTASIATLLTLSCSNEEGNENPSSNSDGSFLYTKDYDLVSKTSDQFTYKVVSKYERCSDGGVLEIEDPWDETINYSINNNVLTWQIKGIADTLNFNGASNELIGAWTRTRDNAHCINYDYYCNAGYDMIKTVFTETTISITQNICTMDKMTIGPKNGWNSRIVDCNTAEMYKGSDIVTLKIIIDDYENGYYTYTYTYKGESCKYDTSKPKMEAACKKAWDTYHKTDEDYYWSNYLLE